MNGAAWAKAPGLMGIQTERREGQEYGQHTAAPFIHRSSSVPPPAIRAQAGLREGVCRPQAGVRLVWAHTGPRLLSITCDSRAVSRCQRAGAVDVSMARRLSGRTPGFLRAGGRRDGPTVQGTCSTLRILRQVNPRHALEPLGDSLFLTGGRLRHLAQEVAALQ